MINGRQERLGVIFPTDDLTRERKCFLVACDEKTPYFYDLVDRTEDETSVRLVYQSSQKNVSIRKTFTVYKYLHQIDFKLDVEPQKGLSEGIGIRIFYPSPVMPALADQDQVSGVILDRKDSFEKTNKDSLKIDEGWIAPSIFGTDNKYFLFALFKDTHSFLDRAYYKHVGKEYLFSILEGPSVTQKSSWDLSFYLGPKEANALEVVDKRLEKALDYYGWLAPISRFLLGILNWLYNYLQNYGFAIIVLTVLMKLIMLPFTIQSERGMKDRLEMQKKLTYLQQRYKSDPDRLALERTELIRKHGTGLGGCLPMLLQIPIFFALSRVLANSIELYQAPMLWIPDLSTRDPYYILPVLVTAGMLAQSTTVDPKQRMPIIAMGLVFGGITASLSSGLALYICMSTLLGVAQSKLLKSFNIV